ncbi:MAG: NYN domain-containing protein [Thermoanaerobaculia bacterium]
MTKRTVAFVDGQNLFHASRESFGYTYPNYDAPALAAAICAVRGWDLIGTRFYTGVPDPSDDAFWNHFWSGKLAVMGRQPGVHVFSRALRYRNQVVTLPDGTQFTFLKGEEKGIDVRIAVDVIRNGPQAGVRRRCRVQPGPRPLGGGNRSSFDLAGAGSVDQDRIRFSAFPLSPTTRNRRGINNTEWIPIERATYDACLDLRNYRRLKS